MRAAILTGSLVAGGLALGALGCGRAREAGTGPAATSAHSPASPSSAGAFDCAQASTPVGQAVCGDPGLAALDRELGAAWGRALAKWSERLAAVARERERSWIASRDACLGAGDPRACLEASYRRRLVEVRIESGQLQASPPVDFVCPGHEAERFAVVHFAGTDPPAAVITFGARQVVALAQPTGSGSRYAAPEVDFREHGGEATVVWAGVQMVCSLRR